LRRAAAAGLIAVAMVTAVYAAVAQERRTPLVHTWKRIFYGELDGKERLLFSGGFERAKPALGDLDGDGDAEMVVGTAQGRVMLFENRGSATAPRWRLAAEALRADHSLVAPGPGAGRRAISVGRNAAPALVDIDGDDDMDLLVGSDAGGLYFFRNTGNRYLPSFRLENPNFLGGHIGRNLVVSVADVNNDGLADLGAGNADGAFYLLINQGSRFAPRFCLQPEPVAPDCLVPRLKLGQLDPEDNAVPAWVDWDADGDLDLMVGKSDGKIAYYRNLGDRQEGKWEFTESRFLILDAGGYAAPLFSDLNGDGRPDLLLASDGEQIAHYINLPEGQGAALWLEDRNVLGVARLGRFQSRLHSASGDLNGDGKPELVIGTRGGQLLIYENVGSKGKIALRSPGGPLLPTPVRAYSVPALVDIDGDGDLDLLVGDRNGRLELIQNSGTPQKPTWKIVDLFYGQIDVGTMSAPAFYDVDGDGDLDLIMGNSVGNVVLYQNRGTAKRPDFVLRSVRFAELQMSGTATPSVFRFDPKADPIIVVGNRGGRLHPALRDPARRVSVGGGFRARSAPWRGLRSRAYSAPHFMDLSGDNRPDLVLGGESDTLALWRYEGSVPASQLARQRPSPNRNIVPEGPLPERSALAGLRGDTSQADATAVIAQDNTVSSLDPIFADASPFIAVPAAGRGTKPAFIDTDGDGRLDLLVGNRAGKLLLYRNPGLGEGEWRKVTDAFAGYKHGHNAAPAAVDLDGDGDLDLVVGTEAGRVFYWQNGGPTSQPQWNHRPEVFARVRAGKNAVPTFFDIDGDKRPDLVVGSLRGRLRYYRNRGGSPPRFKLVHRRYLGIDVGVNSSPHLTKLVSAVRPVLLVGSDRGQIEVLVATGASPLDARGWVSNRFFLEGLKMPPGSHPALADLDSDGDLDLYVGSDKGGVLFFRNNALVRSSAQR
jgi:uncharacterized protein (DUF2141 family)